MTEYIDVEDCLGFGDDDAGKIKGLQLYMKERNHSMVRRQEEKVLLSYLVGHWPKGQLRKRTIRMVR